MRQKKQSVFGFGLLLALGVLSGCGSDEEGAIGGNGTSAPGPCAKEVPPYAVEVVPLDDSAAPSSPGRGFGSNLRAYLPVAVGADDAVYLGWNTDEGAVVTQLDGVTAELPGARLGGIAVTEDGFAALLFDPDEGLWAEVARFARDGSELSRTELFRSSNLEDEGTKGEPGSSRLGYIPQSDQLVAYFGHTQRYDDGVRHQGGYLATVGSDAEQELLSGWFGSHNLDQRLWTGSNEGAVLGLGDAYPVGIFFARLGARTRPRVVYRLAAAGNGTANGQLGGLVEVGEVLMAPFITNRSVSPDTDAGEWPNIDENVSAQIREAASNGRDLGLLSIPKSGELPEGDAPTVWLDPELSEGARLVRLKSAPYGDDGHILLLWGEATGENRNATTRYFTMVVDAAGAVCQPKTELDDAYAVTAEDDLVRAPDGSILWAKDVAGGVSLVRLTP